ncbi:isocitrate lyase/PEP mutase family protein [Amycolatopsis pigmentata]|uniref:Oxaloacetate decarboxylase n=1 Tax=Amycolatopsis pigmentata TaxID=450801 RepID=A0ABW5FZ30_9PSEU
MADLLAPRPSGPARLRELLAGPGPVVAPGAYDALSARMVEAAGFPAVYLTGFGTTASLLGRPDVGLLTMTEMVDAARRMVSAVAVPVIADADTGYGNALNVIRTVQEYEAAGVAGLHLEDQVSPKRCGHFEGKEVIEAESMMDKVGAAVAARRDPDFLLIARTDARAVEGLDAAIERARGYHEAGADVLFVEALRSESEIETVATALGDVPLLFNWAEGGRTPPLSLDRITELGFRVVIFPVSTLLAATEGMRRALDDLRRDGTPVPENRPGLAEFAQEVGIAEIDDIAARFGRG